MKAIQVVRPGELVISDQPLPVPEIAGHVLIQIKAAGICGSDISIFRGTSPVAVYPRIIGHEFAGEVVSTGANVSGVDPGDHVVVNPVIQCGECPICKRGRGNVCANLQVIGVHVDGGFREYVSVPEKNVFKISSDIAWEEAAIIEPYTVAAQVTSRGGVQAGDTVLILGCGQIALTILQVCKLIGASCIMTDLVASRLERAKEFGADEVINSAVEDVRSRVLELTGGLGVDVSIDAACVGKTLEQAAECTRSAGVVVTMGFAERIVPITELAITKNELDIRGSRLNNNKFPQVIEWVESGKLQPRKIITHKLPFTDVLEGFEKIKNDPENTLKVILTFEQE
ncbi:zinc-binding alcohol dehydrogenase family protein [Oscillospiraceae bacterium LTW-04]|nr:zinc-binding alcohol dehydrogenase family protein [Oscillospiraceae bacterium MB24-C1]